MLSSSSLSLSLRSEMSSQAFSLVLLSGSSKYFAICCRVWVRPSNSTVMAPKIFW